MAGKGSYTARAAGLSSGAAKFFHSTKNVLFGRTARIEARHLPCGRDGATELDGECMPHTATGARDLR